MATFQDLEGGELESKWRALACHVPMESFTIYPSQEPWELDTSHHLPGLHSITAWPQELLFTARLWNPRPTSSVQSPWLTKTMRLGNELRYLEYYPCLCLDGFSQSYPSILPWPRFCKLHKWPKIPFPTTIWKPQDIIINRFPRHTPMRTLLS